MNHKEEIQAKLDEKKAELEKLELLATQRKYNNLSPAEEMPKAISYFFGGLGVMGLIGTAIAAIFAPISVPVLIGSGVFLTIGGTLFAIGQSIERRFYTRKYKLKNDIFELNREIGKLSAELGKENSDFLTKQNEKENHKTKRYVQNPFWGKDGAQVPSGDNDKAKNTPKKPVDFEVDLSNLYNSFDYLDEENTQNEDDKQDKQKENNGDSKQ